MKDYSQNGETSILSDIFDRIGTTNRFAVEFGAKDGYHLSNIRGFLEERERVWHGLQMDGEAKGDVKSHYITAENINELFDIYNVPDNFDLLSIDIDGNDYWIWKAINRKARVVIIEYNSNFDIHTSAALKYDKDNRWTRDWFYSASYLAMKKLGESKGYFLHKEMAHQNLIFVLDEGNNKDILGIIDESKVVLPWPNHNKTDNKEWINV